MQARCPNPDCPNSRITTYMMPDFYKKWQPYLFIFGPLVILLIISVAWLYWAISIATFGVSNGPSILLGLKASDIVLLASLAGVLGLWLTRGLLPQGHAWVQWYQCRTCKTSWAISQPPYQKTFDVYQNRIQKRPLPTSPLIRATYLHNAAVVEYYAGNSPEAERLLQESLSFYQVSNNPQGITLVQNTLAGVLPAAEVEQTAKLAAESVQTSRELGFWSMYALSLTTLGYIEMQCGELDQAESRLKESLALKQKLRMRTCVPDALIVLTQVASTQGNYKRAARLIGAADGLLEENWWPLAPSLRRECDRLADEAHAKLGEASYSELYEEGYDLQFDEILNYGQDENVLPE